MKYRVMSGFVHEDGKSVDPGDIVEIENDALAKHYLSFGRIAVYDEKSAAGQKEASKTAPKS